MNIASKQLGIFGEEIASNYLKQKKYKILEKNYYSPLPNLTNDKLDKGEIDIIAKKHGVISFVEVKTIKDNINFNPEDKVNFQKQKKLIKLAEIWLNQNKIPLDSKWQIDIIGIKIDLNNKKAKIRHFKNAVC